MHFVFFRHNPIAHLIVYSVSKVSLVAQWESIHLPMQAMWVRSLGWEDLEMGMAIHSSIPTWRTPWTEEPGKLQSMESQKSQTQLSD